MTQGRVTCLLSLSISFSKASPKGICRKEVEAVCPGGSGHAQAQAGAVFHTLLLVGSIGCTV